MPYLILLVLPALVTVPLAVYKGYSLGMWLILALSLNIIALVWVSFKPNLRKLKMAMSKAYCPHCNKRMSGPDFFCTACKQDELFESDYNFDF